jgi:hypothetical protein
MKRMRTRLPCSSTWCRAEQGEQVRLAAAVAAAEKEVELFRNSQRARLELTWLNLLRHAR